MRRSAPALLVCLLAVRATTAAPDVALRTLVQDGHFKRALAALEPRVKANPNDAEAAALLSRVRLAFGERDEAVRLAERAATIEPGSVDYRWWLAEAIGRQAQRAGMLKQIGLARRFRKEAEAVIALDPKHVDARMGLMVFYIAAPGIVGGDTKKAQQMVDEIAKIDPASGFIARIRYLEETKTTGDVDGLLKQAADAAKSTLTAFEAHAGLMNRHLAAAPPRLDAAEREARELIAIAPDRQAGYSGVAAVCATTDRFADLETLLADAERAIPDNLNPYYQAARVLQTRGADLPRAERYLRKYLSQRPEANMPSAAAAHWRLGLVYEKLGRRADALAALQEAVKLDPGFE